MCLSMAWLWQLSEVSAPCPVGYHPQLVCLRQAGLDAGCHLPCSTKHSLPGTSLSFPPVLLRWELGNLSGHCRVSREFSTKVYHRVKLMEDYPLETLVVQKLSLSATILGVLGMTYKLSSKK